MQDCICGPHLFTLFLNLDVCTVRARSCVTRGKIKFRARPVVSPTGGKVSKRLSHMCWAETEGSFWQKH